MTRVELLDLVSEAIVNNSNIGAEPDDEVLFNGLEDVMLNVGEKNCDIVIQLTDGKAFRITAEEI